MNRILCLILCFADFFFFLLNVYDAKLLFLLSSLFVVSTREVLTLLYKNLGYTHEPLQMENTSEIGACIQLLCYPCTFKVYRSWWRSWTHMVISTALQVVTAYKSWCWDRTYSTSQDKTSCKGMATWPLPCKMPNSERIPKTCKKEIQMHANQFYTTTGCVWTAFASHMKYQIPINYIL